MEISPHYDHPTSRWALAVKISLGPMYPGEYLLYRLPEQLCVGGTPVIDQPAGEQAFSPNWTSGIPDWQINRPGVQLTYQMTLRDQSEFALDCRAEGHSVQITARFCNRSDVDRRVRLRNCLMLWNAPSFIDRQHQRTVVRIAGVDTALVDIRPNYLDYPTLPWAIFSKGHQGELPKQNDRNYEHPHWPDGGRITVHDHNHHGLRLAWEGAQVVMARSAIPCLHSDPAEQTVAPGEEVTFHGSVELVDMFGH